MRSNPAQEARNDLLKKVGRMVDRLAGDPEHLNRVCQAAINMSAGSAAKRAREQADDLHSAIVHARDPELARKWEVALDGWCDAQDGVADLKIFGWALEANEARSVSLSAVDDSGSGEHKQAG